MPDLPHQVRNASTLLRAIRSTKRALDFSETGTGKTRTALRVIRDLSQGTLVVGPKVSKTAWLRAGIETKTEFDYINWEMLRTGKTPYGGWFRWQKTKLHKPEIIFRFAPEVRLVVADEIHRAKGVESQNAEMVRAVVAQDLLGLGMTASPASSPVEMRALGNWMGLHEWRLGEFNNWLRCNGCSRPPWGGMQFTKNRHRAEQILKKLAASISDRTVRTTLREIFPQNALVVEPLLLDIDEAETAAALAEEIAQTYRLLRGLEASAEFKGAALERQLRARQALELLKVAATSELIDDHRNAGKTVLLFCNFQATVDVFAARYPEAGVIVGDVKPARRQEIIDAVAKDEMNLVLLNTAAGSESVNFQDITGTRGRVELVLPGTSAEKFLQLLGRVDRLNSMSVPLAQILIAAGTEEEKIYRNLQRKVGNIRTLTDRDFEFM